MRIGNVNYEMKAWLVILRWTLYFEIERQTDIHTYTERALLDKVRRTEIHAINKG